MKSKKLLNLFLPVIALSVITSTTMVFAESNSVTANPTSSALLVDGEQVNFSAYNINGNNYFKLRDLAYILNGSLSQFDIGFDSSRNLITINTNQNYNAVGGEMTGNGNSSQRAVVSKANLMIDGQKVNLTAYNIGGNNFFMLRDLAAQIGFGVDWNAGSSSIMINTGGTLTTNSSDYVEYEEDYHSEGVFYQEDEEEYIYVPIGKTIDLHDYLNQYGDCSFDFVRPEYDGVSYEFDLTRFTPFYRDEYILEIQYDIGDGEIWGKYIHFIAE